MPWVRPRTACTESVAAQVTRLGNLVENYLSLVRGAEIERTPQNLGAAVQAWVADMQRLAAAGGVTVQVTGIQELGEVAFDTHSLRRVVLNLAQNALEAMPQGGTLTLTGQHTATQVQLQVQDTGSGIPAAQLPTLFEPLQTTKPGGTGLGLYIVQEILAAHGGQVTVESQVGEGTTFTIILPRVVDATQVGMP